MRVTMSGATQPTRVLVVGGTGRAESNVDAVVSLAASTAAAADGDVRRLDLAEAGLPMLAPGDEAQELLAAVQRVRADASWAEAFVIVTPEYHGNMSGALKNWFDFLYGELAGKLAGVVSVTGGGGGDMSIASVRHCFQWCHGFVLPFAAAARAEHFDDGMLVDPRVRARIERISHDVVRYAGPIGAAFREAQTQGAGVDAGVAGLHPPATGIPEDDP